MRRDIAIVLVATHLAALAAGVQLAGMDVSPTGGTTPAGSTATANIVAVAQDGSGTVGEVTARIEPGSGRVLLDTNPFVETDTQFSAKTARQVAAEVTGTDLSDRNVVYTFSIEGDYLGGPSAGAAMTLATIAAIENRSVRDDAVVTGTVRPDGRIGKVGKVAEKSVVAGENGMELFVVPDGQETLTYYERDVRSEQVGGFVYRDVQYVPREIALGNLTERRFGMRTAAATTVGDAADRMLR